MHHLTVWVPAPDHAICNVRLLLDLHYFYLPFEKLSVDLCLKLLAGVQYMHECWNVSQYQSRDLENHPYKNRDEYHVEAKFLYNEASCYVRVLSGKRQETSFKK